MMLATLLNQLHVLEPLAFTWVVYLLFCHPLKVSLLCATTLINQSYVSIYLYELTIYCILLFHIFPRYWKYHKTNCKTDETFDKNCLYPLAYFAGINDLHHQKFGSRWISIERKSIWTARVNECYVYCFPLRWSINSWNNCYIWD